MRYISNIKIIWISKLFIKMGNFNEKYDQAEIYNNSNKSMSDSNNNVIKKRPELLTVFSTHSADNNFDSFYTPCLFSK